MKQDIRLFIHDEEIEFSADPKILLSYKETELHAPTIIRNSYSKQITVEGTPRNNAVFGHIWNLERIQEGSVFNPIKKADFQLFVNDELFQKGYVKLDQVTRTNNTTQYKFTLYGGLGSFFYNLAFDEDNSGNNKKTLASLKYALDSETEPDLDFTIDKDNVYEAWGQIAGFGQTTNARWNVINFVPALNGIPNDFDASTVLINNSGLTTFQKSKTEDGITYKPVLNGSLNNNGYSLGEMPEDLQEWQTRDLRSYNQRPAISMYRIIQACCNPENNGGYEVKLDDHFFNYKNPYYFDAWVTLPMLKDLDGVGGGETYNITGATIATSSTNNLRAITFNSPTLASLNNVSMNVSVRFTPTGDTTSSQNLYAYRNFQTYNGSGRDHVKSFQSNCGVMMQMFAYGQNGEVVGQSKAYLIGGYNKFPYSQDPMWEGFWNPEDNNEIGVQPEYEFVKGYWKKISGNYVFVNDAGQQTDINFSFSAPNNFASLVLKVKQPRGEYTDYYRWNQMEAEQNPNSTVVNLYTSNYRSESGNYTYAEALQLDRVRGKWNFVVTSMEGIATDYEGLFSGTKITKERLLTTENSPADYLLSYAKMFGLYFYYDSTEESEYPDRYPSGVVHIMDRDTFYTEEVMDLSKMIDWNKKIDITPALASSKWYRFDVQHVDSELENGYKEQYGQAYGSQLVNTNYNFDSNTKDLYDGNVFKAANMALEKDKYYKKSPQGLPVYQYNGLTYSLFHRSNDSDDYDTVEIEYPVTTTMKMTSVNPDYEFYDAFPKLELHGQENQPTDGSNVLVFYRNQVSTNTDYWLTDDVTDMVLLNDGNPCWILTNSECDGAGNQIAKKLNYFPYFSRDLVLYGNYGNIVCSWNFGHPQVIYSPDTYTTDGDSIYDKCWRDYMRDLYSVDTRKLTCYVKAQMDERPWPYWLRRFYWFENSIWALNEIKDLNPASFDTTKMEFIKVQDMNNYKLAKIEYQGNNNIVLDQTEIGCAAGYVTGTIYIQGGGGWWASDWIGGTDGEGNRYSLESQTAMTPYSGRGQTVTTFRLNLPANTGNSNINWYIAIEDDFDNWYRAEFTQKTCNTGSTLDILPDTATVGSRDGSTSFATYSERVTGITYQTNVSWVELTTGYNSVTASYDRNTGTTARQAIITVSGTGVEGPISDSSVLTQNAPGEISTNTQNLYFEWNETAPKTFNVITDDDWTSSINDN